MMVATTAGRGKLQGKEGRCGDKGTHATRDGRNCLILADGSNVFNAVNKTAVLEETTTCVRYLWPNATARPAHVSSGMDLEGGTRRPLAPEI